MYTLVAICGCCSEPNVIMKSESITELKSKKLEIDNACLNFEKEFSMEELYQSLKIEDSSQLFSKFKKIEDKREEIDKEPLGRVLSAAMDLAQQLILDEAPEYFGMNLHIL